jgi:signal peptidase II
MSLAIFLLFVLVSFALDQSSKFAALAGLRCHLDIGAPGTRRRSRMRVALWCAELVALLALVGLVPEFGDPVPSAGLGSALGGGAGNLYDRLSRGGVVDFIDVGFWPVFNLADVAIVAGVAVALISVV